MKSKTSLFGLLALFATAIALTAPPARAASLAFVDPVSALLNGPAITSDVNQLATGGTAVEGIGGDGVSQIVVRVSADSPGEQFTFQIFNDQNQPSTSTANDGALGAIGGGSPNRSQLIVTSVSTSSGPMAFAIYRAPIDFPRPGGGDANAAQRSVAIHWQAAGAPAASSESLTIIRPLVVLVHGLWGTPSDFDNFTPFLSDPRFAIQRANFSFNIGHQIVASTPWYFDTDAADANSLGFSYNAQQITSQVDNFINAFKAGANPAGIAVASVQADIVGHSMGGNITRTLPLEPYFASDTTFARGDVHKLITIDTPHLGSPLATQLLLDDNACVADTLAVAGLFTFQSVALYSRILTFSGAMGDLSGNGTGASLSAALAALQADSTAPIYTPEIPTAFIAGNMNQQQLDGLEHPGIFVDLLRDACFDDTLAKDLTVSGWPTVVSKASDAIVPLTSQVNNLAGIIAAAAIHSPGAEDLGFLAPSALDAATPNPDRTVDLLNTPLTDPTYAALR